MTRTTLTGDDAECRAAIARGPAYFSRYMSRLIAQRDVQDAARKADADAAERAEKRARNAARMRAVRALARHRRDAIRSSPTVPPATPSRFG